MLAARAHAFSRRNPESHPAGRGNVHDTARRGGIQGTPGHDSGTRHHSHLGIRRRAGGLAALVVATAALAALPVATLLPLLFLAAVFEAVFALHIGVERIGRYIQVFFEEDDGWEHTAMAYSHAYRGGTDPLFTLVFAGAAILNFVPALIAEPVLIEVLVIGFAHVLFVVRLAIARREAGRQRAVDLDRFEKLRAQETRDRQDA